MDPSTNSSLNGAQHTKGQSYNLLEGIQAYASTDGLQNGEDLSRFFDPELFDTTTIGSSYAQPALSMSQDYDPNTGRPSGTPDPQHYNNVPQRPFPHHQYSQPFYDSRQLNQANYDPRFFSRPSASPVGFEGGYSYQHQMRYPNQQFGAQQLSMQSQTPPPSQNYAPRQQQQGQSQQLQYVNMGPHPTQLSHVQGSDMMRFGAYSDQTHQPANHHFVDPSMLNANQMMHTNTNHGFQTQQPYMAASYFKTGSTVDPRSLQGGQPMQPMPPATSQTPIPGVTIQPKPQQDAKPTAGKPQDASKNKRGRPRKDASAKSTEHPSGSGTDSDDELEILEVEDEQPPEKTPNLLCVAMPTDERGRALYTAVQAIWTPRNRPASPEQIRGGIARFGDVVRGLRDAWKTKNESLRKAELPDSPTAADAPSLKEEVARYRQVMETVMTRSLLYGHPDIVDRLGENQFTMSALYSFMLDRFNAADYDSSLLRSILKFVVEFGTLDTEMLEMTKMSKILQRLTKKATSDVKTLAQTVLDNAVAATAKKASITRDKKADKPMSPKSVGSPADGTRKESATGVKRLREGDGSTQPAPKKVAKSIPQSSKPLALQNAERRKALEAAHAAKAGEKATSASAGTTANPAAKAKVAVAAPPKSSLFASLASAPKKPGTSNAERAAAAAKEKASTTASPSTAPAQPAKKLNTGKESPPRNGVSAPVTKAANASSFLGLLADMEKRPEKEAKKENEVPNETEEQKAKRLRKEARRKLRVTWKADAELVETRLFTHDPDEELDQGDRLKRDAGDTGREGEALKHHKNLDDLDDEEDEDSFEDFEPYTSPSEVDFSYLEDALLGEDSPHLINSPKFGGSMKPTSPSSEAQNKYEQDTLMALYTSKADRPPTPKEPDDTKEDEGDFEPAEPDTPFGEPSEQTRRREKEYLARQVRTTPATDLATQIQAMSASQMSQPQPGAIPPELQRALSMLGRSNQPNQPSPAVQATPAANVNLQALLQTVLGNQPQGQPQQAQYPSAGQSTTLAPNLGALWASMQQGAQGGTSAKALPVGLGGNPNPYVANFDDGSRKHGRSDSNENDNDYEYGRKGGTKKKKGDSKPYLYKTLMCTFWEQGKCIKGDACTYRHGDEDD
ncbi:hypothetical protein AYL99_06308 [Fonsecaea erecta]|uniref:C3H1-type domain-containing protein n=1 Tax=Fonsecaea erecta TaxID=1367422 RepID=A0A178ZHQ1_9EURO|nr:hypothetical protein AYL99_06308 [Fonsecaea erecta]OAP59011.1 hypothetical protein AYL99_06308 [Fonsecaea erecta]